MKSSQPQQQLNLNYDDCHVIASFLEPQDLHHFSRTCKDAQSLFKKPLQTAAVNQLLEFVVSGQQQKAETLVQRNPGLLLKKGKVTDYSNRCFHQITAFQYALWAKDRHMWQMLCRYLSEEHAAEQLREHENETNPYVKNHGKYYSFEALKNALRKYVDYMNTWNTAEFSWDTAEKIWYKEVGLAQYLAPMHVANEYCHPLRSFEDPRESFTQDSDLHRSFSFYNSPRTMQWSEWFTAPPRRNYGVFRGIRGIAEATSGGMPLDQPPHWSLDFSETHQVNFDWLAIIALDEVRTQELNLLKEKLALVPLSAGVQARSPYL